MTCPCHRLQGGFSDRGGGKGGQYGGAGPDFTGLFCGSEGLFGVALEITLRLLLKLEKFHTFWGYRSLQLGMLFRRSSLRASTGGT